MNLLAVKICLTLLAALICASCFTEKASEYKLKNSELVITRKRERENEDYCTSWEDYVFIFGVILFNNVLVYL